MSFEDGFENNLNSFFDASIIKRSLRGFAARGQQTGRMIEEVNKLFASIILSGELKMKINALEKILQLLTTVSIL
ncbi:CLUMA_CG001742, isoform A [Clunio marinus]|uniref:CLUMA_CG001742, isoform A n=1 Tax=Clunio marinus TaxID=568069 RepID=A0A1J1HKL7_9DIPT|nr:CLUMA_CG001742, isoform A [Clunio marinus]